MKPNIELHYMHRDSDNWKTRDIRILENPKQIPVEELRTRIKNALNDGDWIVPNQCGLPALAGGNWGLGFDDEFHEIEEMYETDKPADIDISIDEVVARLEAYHKKYCERYSRV